MEEQKQVQNLIHQFIPKQELSVTNFEDAMSIQQILLDNGYVVMISREDDLYILNWIWTETPADRNGVIFYDRSTYECDFYNATGEFACPENS